MTGPELTGPEREIQAAFPVGRAVDLAGRPDPLGRTVRAGVLRDLLLGVGTADGGRGDANGASTALRLANAHIIGRLELAHSVIGCPIRFRSCDFDEQIDLYGARTRELSLTGSRLRGIIASGAVVAGRIRLTDCRSQGQIRLVGARIEGALILSGARFEEPLVAFDGSRLYVGNDIVAGPLSHLGSGGAFQCVGEMRLKNAVVDGSVLLEGARLVSRTGTALSGFDLTVSAVLNCCEGFSAEGTVSLAYADVGSRVCFEGATLDATVDPGGQRGGGGGPGTAVNAHHLTTRELSLLPAAAPGGAVDLSHATIGLLRDDPATWPAELRLDGLRYDSLGPVDDVRSRLRWLRLDPDGYRPRVYEHLAVTYRSHGRDGDARTVQLAGQRHRRESLSPVIRSWSYLQDALVGYGYRPIRAAAWIGLLVLAGSLLFHARPPQSMDGTAPSAFHAPLYTLDLLLPLVDLGQEQHFTPSGATIWSAYFLIAAGWILATTVATGITRTLRGG